MDPSIEELTQVFDLAPADADRPARFAKVTAVSGDTVTVSLGSGTADAVRCCTCAVGDVVLVETLPSGQLAAVGTKGQQAGAYVIGETVYL